MQKIHWTMIAAALALSYAGFWPPQSHAEQALPKNPSDFRASPEAESGTVRKDLVTAKDYMVVAANPYASKAGLNILEKGGSAIDAAIATQLVLNIVEPQSSGIGGGAFILHWNNKDKKLQTYDGRETAPQSAKPNRFLKDGRLMNFANASFGGHAVGVPGLLRAMELAHQQHGRLQWSELFKPAIDLARNGFRVSPRLRLLLVSAGPQAFGPDARAYFFDKSGKAWPIGHRLKNEKFAETLEQIAKNGSAVFYDGPIADSIVDKVRSTPINPGDLSREDLRAYRAKERPPVCITYRRYKVCGMGPPSSGAITIAQTLKLVEPFNLKPQGTFDLKNPGKNVRILHFINQAQALSFADRNRYLADSDFVAPPKGLLSDAYLKERRQLIDINKSIGKASPGRPDKEKEASFGKDNTQENKGTSHISIVDREGNGVSMTTTIESGFGANIMAAGFLLNNELTDFAFKPQDKDGRPVANRIEPGKRPRSSMAPTMVFDENDQLILLTGSPGGSRIILYVTKALIAHLDFGMNAQQAAALPNFGNRNRGLEIERHVLSSGLKKATQDLGYQSIKGAAMTSGVHTIFRRPDGTLEGGADPRREGLVLGK